MIYRVSGLFEVPDAAAAAVRELRARGFTERELTVVSRADDVPSATFEHVDQANKTTAAWTGTALGAAVGGYLGLLSMVLVPALPLLVVGGAALGGTIGTLTGLGVADRELQAVQETLERGGALLMVRDEDEERAQVAKRVLEQTQVKTVSWSTQES